MSVAGFWGDQGKILGSRFNIFALFCWEALRIKNVYNTSMLGLLRCVLTAVEFTWFKIQLDEHAAVLPHHSHGTGLLFHPLKFP